MPFYPGLRVSPKDSPAIAETKRRTATRLITLKAELDKTIPAKRVDDTLLLATWNVRELGEGKFRGWSGERATDAPGTPAPEGDADEAGMRGGSRNQSTTSRRLRAAST